MKKYFIILFFFFIFPVATAFNCNELESVYQEMCTSVMNSNLTNIEKDLLITDLINPNKEFPNHDLIYQWNLNINFEKSPDGKISNKGSIKNAWVKIISPMSSVIENDTLYVSRFGNLLTRYNYEVELSSGTQNGDCKTKYSLVSKNEELSTYINGRKSGNNELSSFTIFEFEDSVEFKSKLTIEVKYQIKHYNKDEEGYCVYDYSEYKTDVLELTDLLTARTIQEDPDISFKIIDQYQNLNRGILKVKDYSAIELNFKDSNFQKTNYFYYLNYTKPYFVLTLRAEVNKNQKTENIHVDYSSENEYDVFDFKVENMENCQIKTYSYFESQIIPCDTSFNKINFNISTDKLIYNENETINLEIFPKDLELNITYANQSFLAKNDIQLKAKRGYNKITAQLNYQKSKRIISIIDEENETFVKKLVSFSFIFYLFFNFLKNYLLINFL